MDAHVTKPVEASRLLEVIDGLVPKERRSARPAAPAAAPAIPISAHPQYQAAPLDSAVVDDLAALGGGSTFFAELIFDFFKDVESLLDDMEGAVRTGDIPALRDAAHALRSCSGNMGALGLREIAAKSRDLTLKSLGTEGVTMVSDLRQEYARVKRALNTRLGEVPSAVSGA
jgi:hypothetical protein